MASELSRAQPGEAAGQRARRASGDRAPSLDGFDRAPVEPTGQPGLGDPGGLIASLAGAPPAERARVLTGLQRASGNGFVQRAIADFRRQRGLAPARIPRESTTVDRVVTASTSGVGEGMSTAPAGPLSDAEVAHAKSWYAARPGTYTPEIITKIQQQVGTSPGGSIDDVTIQAVAKFQQANPPLWVDGIAGPRTMPAVFPVGLAKASEVQGFVKEAKAVQAEWAKLKSAADRATALAKAVNEHLAAAGVPACKNVVKDLGNDSGQFDFTTWTLFLGQGPFSQATITDKDAADIADTVFHEARHSEQWFMMAQLLAGKGLKAAVIATTMSIPADIATAAAAKPLKKGSTEAIEAEGWYDSVYGSNADYRNRVLDDVEVKDNALKKARAEYKKNPTPANEAKVEAARAQFHAAHKRYTELPEEADAWRVGGAVSAAYLKDGKK